LCTFCAEKNKKSAKQILNLYSTYIHPKAVNGRQRLRVDVVQVGVYLQMLVVPRLCLSGEGVWHQAEYLRLLGPALRNIVL
jgi:hypothetical protein